MASSLSSGRLTTSTLIFNGRNRINAITLIADGTNAASISIYDNNAATGKVAAKVSAKAGEVLVHVVFENPVFLDLGLYAALTGTGAEAFVFFGG